MHPIIIVIIAIAITFVIVIVTILVMIQALTSIFRIICCLNRYLATSPNSSNLGSRVGGPPDGGHLKPTNRHSVRQMRQVEVDAGMGVERFVKKIFRHPMLLVCRVRKQCWVYRLEEAFSPT